MFAATPPRLITSESTRNDSAILSSFSGTSWSTNRAGNVIRWSVAIDPVTAMRTAAFLPEWNRWQALAGRATPAFMRRLQMQTTARPAGR